MRPISLLFFGIFTGKIIYNYVHNVNSVINLLLSENVHNRLFWHTNTTAVIYKKPIFLFLFYDKIILVGIEFITLLLTFIDFRKFFLKANK